MNLSEELLDRQSFKDQTRGTDLFVSVCSVDLSRVYPCLSPEGNWDRVQQKYRDVVYHNNVRWLSQESAQHRVYSLREETGQFLAKKDKSMPDLSDPVWLADFGCLGDIRHLYTLNTSLHGVKCSGKPNVFTHQSLWNQAATFPKAPVTNTAQYHTFLIAAGK